VENAGTISGWIKALATMTIPPPPDWVLKIPLVGSKIADLWTTIAEGGQDALVSRVAPYAAQTMQRLAGAAGSVGLLGIEFLLTVVISIIMYTNGEVARAALIRFGHRLAGQRGDEAVILAGQAIRAVALGVVVTALVQTILAGIGLA